MSNAHYIISGVIEFNIFNAFIAYLSEIKEDLDEDDDNFWVLYEEWLAEQQVYRMDNPEEEFGCFYLYIKNPEVYTKLALVYS